MATISYPQLPVIRRASGSTAVALAKPAPTDAKLKELFGQIQFTRDHASWKSAFEIGGAICLMSGVCAFGVTIPFSLLGIIGPLWLFVPTFLVIIGAFLLENHSILAYNDFATWKALREEALSPWKQLGVLVDKHGSLENLRKLNLLATPEECQEKWKLWKESPQARDTWPVAGLANPSMEVIVTLYTNGFISEEEAWIWAGLGQAIQRARNEKVPEQGIQQLLTSRVGWKESGTPDVASPAPASAPIAFVPQKPSAPPRPDADVGNTEEA